LANDDVVQEIFKNITALDIAGKVFCESSTIHPDVTKETERAVVAKKAEFVAGYFTQLYNPDGQDLSLVHRQQR
jgi:3-hydroxyisobutyrate dehydrogenase-like beta-hydroxyacid dehydrogenase